MCAACSRAIQNGAQIKQLNSERKKGESMRVGAYAKDTGGSSERLDLLPASVVGKQLKVKVVSVREVDTPKFSGLAVEVKAGSEKYIHLLNFDRRQNWDLVATVAQMGTDETDDWAGKSLIFVTKQGKKKGTKFVNVSYPQKNKKK
jgi:hypothetical protein